MFVFVLVLISVRLAHVQPITLPSHRRSFPLGKSVRLTLSRTQSQAPSFCADSHLDKTCGTQASGPTAGDRRGSFGKGPDFRTEYQASQEGDGGGMGRSRGEGIGYFYVLDRSRSFGGRRVRMTLRDKGQGGGTALGQV